MSTMPKMAGRPSDMKHHLAQALAKHMAGKELGATEEARLKARGMIPRADGSTYKGPLGKDKVAYRTGSGESMFTRR